MSKLIKVGDTVTCLVGCAGEWGGLDGETDYIVTERLLPVMEDLMNAGFVVLKGADVKKKSVLKKSKIE